MSGVDFPSEFPFPVNIKAWLLLKEWKCGVNGLRNEVLRFQMNLLSKTILWSLPVKYFWEFWCQGSGPCGKFLFLGSRVAEAESVDLHPGDFCFGEVLHF